MLFLWSLDPRLRCRDVQVEDAPEGFGAPLTCRGRTADAQWCLRMRGRGCARRQREEKKAGEEGRWEVCGAGDKGEECKEEDRGGGGPEDMSRPRSGGERAKD